jgi:hypothetical protein
MKVRKSASADLHAQVVDVNVGILLLSPKTAGIVHRFERTTGKKIRRFLGASVTFGRAAVRKAQTTNRADSAPTAVPSL